MSGVTKAKKADLVLEGGGVKGIGLVGAIHVLHEHGYSFPRIAGTSAGAIVGTLTAAYQAAGRPLSEIADIMRELDYRAFRDGVLLDRLGPPGKAVELMLTQGIYKGEFLVEWLTEKLVPTGVRTWGD